MLFAQIGESVTLYLPFLAFIPYFFHSLSYFIPSPPQKLQVTCPFEQRMFVQLFVTEPDPPPYLFPE